MIKNLVIVESPTKAKMLSRFLGKDFTVESSFGHIRDLPNKKTDLPPEKRKLPGAQLGIDIEDNFSPLYVIPEKAKACVQKLKKLLMPETTLWLATDEDREGEGISWHLLEVLRPKKTNAIHRIVFHEITQSAIQEAVKHPRSVDMNVVDAQQVRRILDRLVGYNISPLLWKKIRFGLSAGRVQSVAVKMVVDREREIRAFIPEEYWSLTASFLKEGKAFSAIFQKLGSEKYLPRTASEAEAIFSNIQGQPFRVAALEEKEVLRHAPAPFTTSTLQQEAARKLGFSVKKTMMLSQRLYEGIESGGEAGGLITYMRTDSVHLSEKALSDAENVIAQRYGKEFSQRRTFSKSQKGAQEAHEAIRPTELSRTPEMVDLLPRTVLEVDARRLYALIWQRTLASQMTSARLMQTGIDLEVHGKKGEKKSHVFRATGQRILFSGFLKVYQEGTDEEVNENEESILPQLEKGESLIPKNLEKKQHFTKGPSRYTEASLVKKMESEGIGRPSTYAPTLSTIEARGYIMREGKALVPTDTAFVVTDFLVAHFADTVDLAFTARMESALDDIAAGKEKKNAFLQKFWKNFSETLSRGEEVSRSSAKKERNLGICPRTGKPIFAKYGRFGPMLQRGSTEGEEKPDFGPILSRQSIEEITLEEALKNFELPRHLGGEGEDAVLVKVGKFGPYIQQKKVFVSISEEEIWTIRLEEALEKIHTKTKTAEEKIILNFGEIQVLMGRFGPYITNGEKNSKISAGQDPKGITKEMAEKLLADAPVRKYRRPGSRASFSRKGKSS